MSRNRKFEPYTRRCRPGDKSGSLLVALQMVWYERRCFVLAQHGVRNQVMAVAKTKKQLLDSIVGGRIEAMRRGDFHHPNRQDFRKWAKKTGRRARGEKR